ncbi:2-amino-3-ketobutyrate coenzyme A ligase [Desulfosporosinus orientis DSM 765]|uniref:2-amino-3-ketobutyrate coenzyme A ligase n=1 Tax=Desulfosporosinus orientis (strain ATCC 19365 / DSM 765 / NCIMB 8382 / VKM B-1628 / Singapore I) TaxID=768706 RepID=G7WIF0_DESOD|nr:glycine C-acetyltransferase [Desulfosporosinus orientis]AET68598.1 2-amino-3-ketobutyrate coenzyme A ligase [Desulfosporosinus orientis DSM 765]
MKTAIKYLIQEIENIKETGTYKEERIITTPQSSRIDTQDRKQVLNMCANNYLGLSNNPDLIAAAKEGLDKWGFGLSSVRFICGTQEAHKELEKAVSDFLGMEDTILYSSCFDANGGLFETLLGEEDAVISDELNHASIIDGVRLCKAKRLRYKNNDMADLRAKLIEAGNARIKLIATDGVFSMDGYIANLAGICDLAEEFDALVMVDDSHAVGFMGEKGRGSHEYCGVMGRVDIITGTLGKALGGASGGYTSGKKEIIQLLRQRSRPYLFSNTLAPSITAAAIKTLDMLKSSTVYRDKVHENAHYFREQIAKIGLDVLPGTHPIVPIMLYDAKKAAEFARRMLEKGVYVIAFSYPVVPLGKARIRTQVSAGHSKEDLDFAVSCFKQVKEEMAL